MARLDYYGILGVKRDAGTDDIKKAFRALALEYHPDRNPGDADAERRFREVAEAYQTLSDAPSRARYDRLGPLYRPDGKAPSPDDINDFVSDALSNLFRRKKPGARGDDLRFTLRVDLEAVAAGTERTIQMRRQMRCGRCEGAGAEPDDGRQKCDICDGSGRSGGRFLMRTTCGRCQGRGFIVLKPCKRCAGAGRLDQEERLKVRVPAGVATGQKLKLRGKGDMGEGDGSPGDLLVLISVDEHALFRRRGADVFCEVPVLYTEAALGTDLLVPTLQGRTTIRVPAGTPSGKVFRLAGRGLPAVDGRKRGDLHIKLLVEVPAQLDATQRAALKTLSDSLAPASHPRRQAYDQALADRPTTTAPGKPS